VQRNRELILRVAREAFTELGSAATFEEIVRRSGIGVGTLYRHFPNRDALLEAVYLAEIERLAVAEQELSESLPPVEALRQWLYLSIEMLSAKLAMKEALSAMVGGTDRIYATSGRLLTDSINRLVARAIDSGEIEGDFDPVDLLRAVNGLATSAAGPDWVPSARRMVDVLVAGLRSGRGKP